MKSYVACLLGLTGLVVGGCVVSGDAPPFDPMLAQQSEIARSRQSEPMELRPLSDVPIPRQPTTRRALKVESVMENDPTTTQPAAGSVRLPLQEIIRRVARNNGDVRVAAYEPAIDETRYLEAAARFDISWFLNMQYQRQDQQTTGTIDAFTSTTSRFKDYERTEAFTTETGFKKLMESGGEAQIKYSMLRSHSDPQRYRVSPYYQSELELQITQPLLQNFGYEVNHARITIARNTQRISLLEYRKTLEEQLLAAEQSYWELYANEKDVRIQETLLERTIKTRDLLEKRLGNDVTTLQYSQAAASVEARRSTLVRARARVKDSSDKLKQLMNDADLPVASLTTVLPANAPLQEPISFSLRDQIDAAMANRLELGQQQIRIDSAGIAMLVARNNQLPQVNLQGTIGANGMAPLAGSALSNQWEYEYLNWSVGVQVEVPIGGNAANAIWRRAQLQRLQAIESYSGAVRTVALDVTTSSRDVQTSWEEFLRSRESRIKATEALSAIQSREDANEPLTYSFVQLKLQQQEQLAQAEQQESQAIARYNVALSRLEKAKGTILRYNNIILEEENSPFSSRNKLKANVGK